MYLSFLVGGCTYWDEMNSLSVAQQLAATERMFWIPTIFKTSSLLWLIFMAWTFLKCHRLWCTHHLIGVNTFWQWYKKGKINYKQKSSLQGVNKGFLINWRLTEIIMWQKVQIVFYQDEERNVLQLPVHHFL